MQVDGSIVEGSVTEAMNGDLFGKNLDRAVPLCLAM